MRFRCSEWQREHGESAAAVVDAHISQPKALDGCAKGAIQPQAPKRTWLYIDADLLAWADRGGLTWTVPRDVFFHFARYIDFVRHAIALERPDMESRRE